MDRNKYQEIDMVEKAVDEIMEMLKKEAEKLKFSEE